MTQVTAHVTILYCDIWEGLFYRRYKNQSLSLQTNQNSPNQNTLHEHRRDVEKVMTEINKILQRTFQTKCLLLCKTFQTLSILSHHARHIRTDTDDDADVECECDEIRITK